MNRLALFIFSCAIIVSQYCFAFKMISFNGKVARWHSNTINYVVDSRGSDDFTQGCDNAGTCVTERAAIAAAFNSWKSVPNVNLQFNEASPKIINQTGYNNENSIKWEEEEWTSLSFAPPAGAIAVTVQTFSTKTNEILDMDIHLNGKHFSWSDINSSQERNAGTHMDIQNIMTHEIGHGLGFDHTSEDINENSSPHYLATMFYASGPGETFRRDLKQLDIAAAQHSYPANSISKPSVESVSQNEFDLSNKFTHQVEIEGTNFTDTTLVSVKVGSNNDDVQAKIISRTQSHILAEFDFSGVPSGNFDLIIANSSMQEDIDISLQAIIIDSPYAASDEFSNTSNASTSTSASGCQSSNPALMFMLFLLLTLSLKQKKDLLSSRMPIKQ